MTQISEVERPKIASSKPLRPEAVVALRRPLIGWLKTQKMLFAGMRGLPFQSFNKAVSKFFLRLELCVLPFHIALFVYATHAISQRFPRQVNILNYSRGRIDLEFFLKLFLRL